MDLQILHYHLPASQFSILPHNGLQILPPPMSPSLLFSLLLLIQISNFHSIVSAQCNSQDSSSLLQFKHNLSASILVSWNNSTDCCDWEGVSCDEARHNLISLDLSSKLILVSTQIDFSALFKLRYLRKLNLANNNFNSSPIPSGFGKLIKLTHLNLSNSGFGGQIPIEISRLQRLVLLDLSTFIVTAFSGLPLVLESPKLGTLVQNLTNLRELYLDGVNISAQGSGWCQVLSNALPNLRVLSLSGCSLSGPIHSSLSRLHNLTEIRLRENNFSSALPDFFVNFSLLRSLRLTSCGLIGNFPEGIFRLQKLEILDISNNGLLTGNLPEFRVKNAFRVLSLSQTKLSGALPNSIGNLRSLNKLDLANCNFSGSIPSSLSNLTRLVTLDLSSNNFDGKLPSLESENITEIKLPHNRLTGSIPRSFGRLKNLEKLDLRNNSINGMIPPSLFTLPSLHMLQLGHNELSGQLREVVNLSSSLLEVMDFSNNKLNGSIPKSVFEFSRLKILSLSSNSFSGTVNLDMFQNLKNLSNLDLSYNRLSIENGKSNFTLFPQIGSLKLAACNISEFPQFSENQTNLYYLDLSSNKIHGKIPKWLWMITHATLVHLNLSHNFLEGLDPLMNFSSAVLAVIDLNTNRLQGPIPIPPLSAVFVDYSNNSFNSSIPTNIASFLTYTSFFSVSMNNLVGEIPPSICNVNYMQVLDLSSNNLSGSIPMCLGEINGSLRVLNLRNNNFHGPLPQNFTSGCNLRTLNLNRNQLEGQVPKTLRYCTMLEVLDLGNNRISDTFPYWLGNLTCLRVLVLRSNRFHGPIKRQGKIYSFPMLQIIDLASNNFTGNLSPDCFQDWEAMKEDEDMSQSKLRHQILRYEFLELSNLYYQDTVTVTIKGLEMELVKILTIFTSIDLSNNSFQGEIPDSMGNLKSLYMLNLSHNSLTGQIPSSFGNLSQLESLDLSVNKLSGKIPQELAKLTFLSVLNLSENNLTGSIPIGSQFQTFNNDSYRDNFGLCGAPLSKQCRDVTLVPRQRSKTLGPRSVSEFNWHFVLIGLGFGGGMGIVVGPLTFSRKGRRWCNKHIDQMIWTFFPSFEEDEIEEEVVESMEENHTEEQAESPLEFCVFCTQLDFIGKRIIHIECTCPISPPPSSSHSQYKSLEVASI